MNAGDTSITRVPIVPSKMSDEIDIARVVFFADTMQLATLFVGNWSNGTIIWVEVDEFVAQYFGGVDSRQFNNYSPIERTFSGCWYTVWDVVPDNLNLRTPDILVIFSQLQFYFNRARQSQRRLDYFECRTYVYRITIKRCRWNESIFQFFSRFPSQMAQNPFVVIISLLQFVLLEVGRFMNCDLSDRLLCSFCSSSIFVSFHCKGYLIGV